MIVEPTPNDATGVAGEHTMLAPGGAPVTLQVAPAAILGPLLVQVTVPFTALPAGGLLGKPDSAAAMSACGTIVTGSVSTLLAGAGSDVVVPAVVVMFNGPVAGAVNVEVHVTVAPAPVTCGSGIGLGVQVCVAPGGNPDNAHVGAAAALGPLLTHVPVTVTGCPAFTLAGTVVVATTSACGTVFTASCAVLLAGTGSALAEPATPVIVNGAPLLGAT